MITPTTNPLAHLRVFCRFKIVRGIKPPNETQATDVQILGSRTRYHAVRSTASEQQLWLSQGSVCELLQQHHIAHVGIMDAAAPFEVVRMNLSGTFMLACIEGEGVVLSDGRWKKIRANQACLQPPFMRNALKCLPGKRWKFAWVRYAESREARPIVSSHSPVTGTFAVASLQAAIEGLHSEASGEASPALLYHWCELVHRYVLRFAQPHRQDGRLWQVWQRVEANLARPWSLAEIAAIACMSEEHLRRVCRQELGRSPMQHLTFLRFQRAQHLLSVTDDKVEVIARAVGFESSFTFSNTFKKWIGWRPSEHRDLRD